MPKLATLQQLKDRLSLTGSSEDAYLGLLLDAIDLTVANYVGRAHVPGYYWTDLREATEYYSGNGRRSLVLKRRPVTAVAGVWVDPSGYWGSRGDGFNATLTAWTSGQQWALTDTSQSEQNGGLLQTVGGYIWPEGHGNIKVTYTAGYTTIPADLTHAALSLAVAAYSQRDKAGPVNSESLGAYSYSLSTTYLAGSGRLQDATSILNGYKELPL